MNYFQDEVNNCTEIKSKHRQTEANRFKNHYYISRSQKRNSRLKIAFKKRYIMPKLSEWISDQFPLATVSVKSFLRA